MPSLSIECIAGAWSGLAQNIVGHPFDTAKVLVQNKMPFYQLRPIEYYRGFLYPTVYSIVSHGFLFYSQSYLDKKLNNKYYSGFLSGILISPMCYTFELIKVKRQVLSSSLFSRQMYGLHTTMARESLAYSFWFGTYFDLTEKYNWSPFTAGGIAGITAWTVSYPIDVIRNREIAQNICMKMAYQQKKLWKIGRAHV